MARFFEIHRDNPEPRVIAKVVTMLREDALLAYPTDSCWALGCAIGSRTGAERIRRIRRLDERHHFTLVCADLAQLGEFVKLSNPAYRSIRAATPGAYTFIVPATREVPRRLAHPHKRTVGVRIPDHPVVLALLHELGEPLVSSTLLLPGEDEPLTEGWAIAERLEHDVDAVLDAGACGTEPSTVVDWSGTEPEVLRAGVGDPGRFG